MAYNTDFETSDKADFIVQISATDISTGEDINWTGAEVAIAISETVGSCRSRYNATIGSGIVLVSALVLELTFTDDQMKTLCPGTYLIDGIFRVSGRTSELIIGTVGVHHTAATLP
jgi:hypothetical protein